VFDRQHGHWAHAMRWQLVSCTMSCDAAAADPSDTANTMADTMIVQWLCIASQACCLQLPSTPLAKSQCATVCAVAHSVVVVVGVCCN
jgi:hypothetical protein